MDIHRDSRQRAAVSQVQLQLSLSDPVSPEKF